VPRPSPPASDRAGRSQRLVEACSSLTAGSLSSKVQPMPNKQVARRNIEQVVRVGKAIIFQDICLRPFLVKFQGGGVWQIDSPMSRAIMDMLAGTHRADRARLRRGGYLAGHGSRHCLPAGGSLQCDHYTLFTGGRGWRVRRLKIM
jgi:hypothetical protein